MIARLAIAAVAAVIVYLLCVLFGPILAAMGIPFAVQVGDWLVKYAGVLAICAGIYVFFSGWAPAGGWPWNRSH